VLRADPGPRRATQPASPQPRQALREAIAVLREAINLDPKRPDLFLYLGLAYSRANQHDRAVGAYQEGLTLDDKHKDLNFQLGVVYEKQGKFDAAVSQFRRVIALDPKYAEAYNYAGYMMAERGIRLDEAEQLIKKALELEPDNGYYIDSLGWAFYQQGRYEDAVRELSRAVELTRGKEDAVIYDHLGEAYPKRRRRPRSRPGRSHSSLTPPTRSFARRSRRPASAKKAGRCGAAPRRAAAAVAAAGFAAGCATTGPAPPAAAPIAPAQAVELPSGGRGVGELPHVAAIDPHGQEPPGASAPPRCSHGTDRAPHRGGDPFGPALVATAGPTTSPSSGCSSAGPRPPTLRPPSALARVARAVTLIRLPAGNVPPPADPHVIAVERAEPASHLTDTACGTGSGDAEGGLAPPPRGGRGGDRLQPTSSGTRPAAPSRSTRGA
jgi:Flp pilus assembly protein TadD